MADEITDYVKQKGPRVIKKHKESEFTDPSSPWYKITMVLGGLSAVPAYYVLNYEYTQFIEYSLAAWSIVFAGIWYKYCGLNPSKAKKTWNHFWFNVDEALGRHTYNRVTTGVSRIERLLGRKLSLVYPVVAIFEGGLVQFDNDQWAVYADLHPQKLSEEERKLHRMFMKSVVDGMYDNQIIKFITTTKVNPRKAVVDYLIKLSGKITDHIRARHINALIQMSLRKKVQPKVTRHYVMIGLGEHKTLESAQIAKNSKLPGMLSNLKRAKLAPVPIENRRKVEKLLREASSETAVL